MVQMDLSAQLQAMGFFEEALPTALSKAGLKDVTELAGWNEMEVRDKSGVNFATSRKLLAAAEKEANRRAAAERERAAAEQAAVDARAGAGMARIVAGLRDEKLSTMLREADLLFEVGPVLLKEGLISLNDLDGVGKDILVQLGLSGGSATKLLMAVEATRAEDAKQQVVADADHAFQRDRRNFPHSVGACPKCGTYNTFRGDPLYNFKGLREAWYCSCKLCHHGWK